MLSERRRLRETVVIRKRRVILPNAGYCMLPLAVYNSFSNVQTLLRNQGVLQTLQNHRRRIPFEWGLASSHVWLA